MEFKVGDKVRVVRIGKVGWETIDWCKESYMNARLEYPNSVATISSVGDDYVEISEDRHRLAISPLHFELLKSAKTKTMVQKIGSMMKRLLDADTQKLVKAGLINGDLEVTDAGSQALMAILFESNKAALVKEAEEIIKESEKTN